MLKRKAWLFVGCLILAAALALAGCSNSSKSPQEALTASLNKASEINSYSFSGKMTLEDLSIPVEGDDPAAGQVISMFKNMDFSWTGVYQADPLHVEMTLSLALKGDLAVNFNIPIVMQKEKLWVKIPNIPFFPLPEDLVGKFLELDLKELAEQSGRPIPIVDPGKSQKFVNDVLAIVFKHVEEEQYLSKVKAADAGLPDGTNVKQVIQFKVTHDQVEPLAAVVVEKIAPELLDLLSQNAEYRDMLGLKQEDLDQAKQDLESARQGDLAEGLAKFKENVKSLDVTANFGIDGKEYPVYTDVHVKAGINEDGQEGSFAFKVVSETKDINQEVKLEYPQGPQDVITMEQLQEQLGALFGADL